MKQLFISLLMVMACYVAMPFVATAKTANIQNQETKPKKQRTTSLWGHVKDSFTKVGVQGVKITLMREDSTVVDTVRVFRNGSNALKPDYAYRFTIPAEPAHYIILAQHPDYEDTYINYNIRYIGRNSYFDAPWHYMKRLSSVDKAYQGESLREVTVKGTRIKVAYKGDTIVYDASAFKLPDGSMLDALVRQLPGAVLKDDGTITVNGRKVDYLTLNGKDFFKGNNKVMLENLPYFTVQNIKVYNRNTDKNRYLGRDVEQKEYVMDVNLKKQYRTGYIGNAEVGGASSDRYMGRVFLSRFTDHAKITAFANVNNINETRNPENNGDWGYSNAPEGKTTNRSAGLNIQTDGTETMYKNTLDVSAFWNDYANYQTLQRTNFLNSGNSYLLEDSHAGTRNRQLSFRNSFNLQLPIWITSDTEFRIGDTDEDRNSRASTLNRSTEQYGDATDALDSVFAIKRPLALGKSLLNMNVNNSMYHGSQLYLYQKFLVNKKLPWGDNLELELNGNYNKRENETYEKYRLDYVLANAPSDNRDIYRDSPTRSYNYEGRLEYSFNFRNKLTLRLYTKYTQSRTNLTEDYYRLDRLDGWSDSRLLGEKPSTADSLMAARSLLNSQYQTLLTRDSKAGLNLNYYRQNDSVYTYVQFHLPLIMRNEKFNYQRAYTDTCASRTKPVVDGELNMAFAWKKWKYFMNASITHRMILPTMANIVAFDNNDPLSVSLNNPNLKTAHAWNFNSHYQQRFNNNRFNYAVNSHFSYTANPVLNGYSYNSQTGAYIYQPQNSDYAWNASLGIGSGGAFDKKQLWTFSVYAQFTYYGNQIMELPSGKTSTQLLGRNEKVSWGRFSLYYRNGDLSTGLDGSLTFKNVGFENGARQSYHTTENNLGYSINYTIPVIKLFVGTSFSWYRYANTAGMSTTQNNYLWNIIVNRSFLKGKKLTVSARVFDLLNSVSNYRYTSSSDYLSMITTERIGRYVMLSLSYKLSIMPKDK